jgi:hypothetical protein
MLGHEIRRYFRARTVWQMHYDNGIADEWNVMTGTSMEATQNAAWAATKKWSRCWSGNATSAFSCYAGSRNRAWKGAKPRALFYEARIRDMAKPLPTLLAAND